MQDNPDDRDAEACVNAVKGLVSVCTTLAEAGGTSAIFLEDQVALLHFIKDEVMSSLLKALDDYSTDNRGDVGSWVRDAAMNGLEKCTYILCSRDSNIQGKGSVPEFPKCDITESDPATSYFDATLATNLIGGIVKQAVEKMDKIRELAAQILQKILYNKTIHVPHIPHRSILEQIIPDDAFLKWGVSHLPTEL